MTIDWYSIVLLLAAVLAATTALLVVGVGRYRSHATRAFVMHSAALACWAGGHFLEQTVLLGGDAAVESVGSTGWFIYLLRAAGMVGAPVAWYMLGMYVSRPTHSRSRILAFAGAFFGITMVLVATNGWTGLLVRRAGEGTALGPLNPPLLAIAAALTIWGTYLLAGSQWRQGGWMRLSAVLLAGLVGTSIVGGVLWVVRGFLGLHMTVDVAPLVFPLISVALLGQVLHRGFADIVPVAAARAFESMSDAAIVTDAGLVITEVNDTARREFPDATVGRSLAEVAPDIAENARACLAGDRARSPFELRLGEGLYEVRVHPTGARDGRNMGCIIMLADVTELRRAQEHLELLESTEANAVSRRTPY